MTNFKGKQGDYDQIFRTAPQFLKNPFKIWNLGKFEYKRAVLRLAFSDVLPYDREKGFRTAPIARPFRLIDDLCGAQSKMVDVNGESLNTLFANFKDWEPQFEALDQEEFEVLGGSDYE